MSWGCYSTFMCDKCNVIYEIENSTLVTKFESNKCPFCNSEEVNIISSVSMLDAMKKTHELFEKRKKE